MTEDEFNKNMEAARATTPEDRIKSLEAAKERLEKSLYAIRAENDVLRGIASKVMPCHYCGADHIAKCKHGFPGCSLADDIFVAEETIGEALRTAQARVKELEQRAHDQRPV